MADNVLTARLKALISFRALFVTLLLGSAFLFRIEDFYTHARAISFLIISLYILTIIYVLLLTKIRNLVFFTYTQLILDVFAEIILIYITGGVESWFAFTLILTVLSSSIVLNKKAGFITASLSSILYGVLLDLQYYGILDIPHSVIYERQFLYKIFIQITSLYIIAYLSGNLTARLEKTSRKLEEKVSDLKDLELFNMKVIESLPSGLFTTDRNGNVQLFNKAAEEITGVKKDLATLQGIDSALPFLSFPFKEGRREEILHTGEDKHKIVGLTVSVLRDASGQETGYIGTFQDLTPFKSLEAEIKQKEKWATIGELSANIAHEIRNPLAAMRGSIEMLKDDKIPRKHKEKLMDIALKEMERLNDIITDFLMYSSPRPLEMKKTDLHLLLDETLSLLKNTEQNRDNISINKGFAGYLFSTVDPQKMRQVFWNLGMNALEAMKDGGELSVLTKDAGGLISISFSDTGPGVPPASAEKIFFPFFTTKDKGTGLGLSIAYRIIEEHKGKLTLKSIPGIKTTFEIILNKSDGTR
jgi:two-component system sensor histidine kinase PilS (NtrC family)